MSKSLGNVISPLDLMKTHGRRHPAPVDGQRPTTPRTCGSARRSWPGMADAYRRLRNTLRYLLGNLAGFSEAERLPYARRCRSSSAGCCIGWPSSTGWCASATREFDFPRLYSAAAQFLRHRPVGLLLRRAQGRALLRPAGQHPAARRAHRARPAVPLPDRLAGAGAGVHRRGGLADPLPVRGRSVHLRAVSRAAGRVARRRRWASAGSASAEIRRVVTGALEVERREKRIGSSLQAAPLVFSAPRTPRLLAGLDLAELAITSGIELRVRRRRRRAPSRSTTCRASAWCRRSPTGEKCARCWQVLPEVGEQPAAPDLCRRCADAVAALRGGLRRGPFDRPCCIWAWSSPVVVVVLDQLTKWAVARRSAGPRRSR